MKKFFNQIQAKHQSNVGLIEEIAQTLDIKYDAAYRRITQKAKLSLEEALVLAKKYHISLDALLEGNENEIVFLTKIPAINDISSITNYLKESVLRLQFFVKAEQAHLIYMSKDLPLMYTLEDNELTKLKFYAWLWMLDEQFPKKNIAFADFQLPNELLEHAKRLSVVFEKMPCTEFWNETTINSILYQLKYFKELGLLTLYDKEKILFQLKNVLYKVEEKAQNKSPDYQLYWNEMLLMNNSIYLKNANRSTLFIPYNILGYIQTSDDNMLQEQQNFIALQKQNSILLSDGNLKMRKLFFKTLHEKISKDEQFML